MEKREIKHFTYFGPLQVEDPLKKKNTPRLLPPPSSFSLPFCLCLRLYSLHDIIRRERPEKGMKERKVGRYFAGPL